MRLFVGIPLPEASRQALTGLCSGLPGARWVAPENMHITLRFIGEVPGAEAEDVDAALAAIRQPAFTLRLAGIDNFASRAKVRSLWAGFAPSAVLVRLRDKVESAIVRAGYDPEGRKFTPHVTIARFKKTPPARVGAFIEDVVGFPMEPFAVRHFTLFESILGRQGAHHRAVAEYPLDED